MSTTSTRRALPALALPLLLLAAACGGSSASAGNASTGATNKLVVAASVAPITSIVSAVGGDRIELHGIVPEGVNSHTFEPAPKVAQLLSTADIVFVNGLKLEDPTAELATSNAKKGSEIVALGTKSLPESQYIYDFSFPEKEGKPNPHLWTDPLFAIKYADEAAATLSAKDPANKAYYEANRVTFDKKATELSDALKTAQATIPGGKKELLTYHDAYAYFGRDYGWKIIGAVQPSNFEDPTAKDVVSLITQIRSEKVPVIFGSEVFPSKILAQIAKESGARYESSLRDDDLPGKPGDDEHSWFGLMRYDYRTMVKGLGGDPAALDALNISSTTPDKADYPQ